MTKQVLNAIQQTKTAQVRRLTIPEGRRKQQAKQTFYGVVVGLSGMLVVKWFGLGEAWYVAAVLLGLRVASKEYMLAAINVFRELTGLKRD